VAVEVAGDQLAPILHGDGRGEALAAGGGAGVQHRHSGLQPRRQHGQVRAGVLDVKFPVFKILHRLEAARAGHAVAVRQPAVAADRELLVLELQEEVGAFGAERIALQDRLRRFIVGRQERLQRVLPERLLQKLYKGLWMAVSGGEIPRLRQAALLAHDGAQNAVYKTGGARVGIFSGFVYRLVHGGRVGDLIQLCDLIDAKPENIQHHGLQIAQARVQIVRDIEIQQHPVLQHAVAEPARERCVAPVEPAADDVFF